MDGHAVAATSKASQSFCELLFQKKPNIEPYFPWFISRSRSQQIMKSEILKLIQGRGAIFSDCVFFRCRRSLQACSSNNLALVHFPFSDPFAVSSRSSLQFCFFFRATRSLFSEEVRRSKSLLLGWSRRVLFSAQTLGLSGLLLCALVGATLSTA